MVGLSTYSTVQFFLAASDQKQAKGWYKYSTCEFSEFNISCLLQDKKVSRNVSEKRFVISRSNKGRFACFAVSLEQAISAKTLFRRNKFHETATH